MFINALTHADYGTMPCPAQAWPAQPGASLGAGAGGPVTGFMADPAAQGGAGTPLQPMGGPGTASHTRRGAASNAGRVDVSVACSEEIERRR